MSIRKNTLLFGLAFGIMLGASAQNEDPTKLIQEMEEAVGGWNKLWDQKDVQFDYNYEYPGMDKKDVSVERYIFDGEHSWAKYSRHDINAMPGKEGEVVQSFVNNKTSCSMNGVAMEDPTVLGTTEFLRRANYFWFTMMYKLNNPGTIHEFLGTEEVNGIAYRKVKVSYEGEKTGKEKNDAYVLYINPDTKLVDQFFFSLPAMGVNQTAIKMEVVYEEINGLKLPTDRKIYMPGPDGKLATSPSLIQTSTNVSFNNGFTPKSFEL